MSLSGIDLRLSACKADTYTTGLHLWHEACIEHACLLVLGVHLNCFGHQRRWDIKTNKNCLAHVFFPFQLVLRGSAVINKTVIYYLVYEKGFQLVPKVIYSIQLGFNMHIQSKLL